MIGLIVSAVLLPGIGMAKFPIRVGASGDDQCDFHTLQEAVDVAAIDPFHTADTIYLASDIDSDVADVARETVTIHQQELTIVGGLQFCGQEPDPGAYTYISGGRASDAGTPVFTITGFSDVTLKNLIIVGGQHSAGYGGGIDFQGCGGIQLNNIAIAYNTAGYGGGISMRNNCPDSDVQPATLIFGLNAGVGGNYAYHDGGGLYLDGNSQLVMVNDKNTINANTAAEHGGGIALRSPASADIGSPGNFDSGTIYDNAAKFGGGIALLGKDWGGGRLVRLFTTDPARPVSVLRNTASKFGGGIFAELSDRGAGQTFCAEQFRIEGNSAVQGTAIYLHGEWAFLDVPAVCHEPPISAPGAVDCGTGVACSVIGGNYALPDPADNNSQNGATIYLSTRDDYGDPYIYGAKIESNYLTARGNSGGYFLRNAGSNPLSGSAILRNALIVDNVVSGELFLGTLGGMRVTDSTIADNSVGYGSVFNLLSSQNITLERNIIYQPGFVTLLYSNNNANVVTAYNITSPGEAPLFDGTSITAEPRFVDAAAGDYHLRVGSPAVDFAPAVFGTSIVEDLDGKPRSVPLDLYQHSFSKYRDVGAYERQTFDPLVENGGFKSNLLAWLDPNSPQVANWTSGDADNNPGSGAALVNLATGTNAVTLLTQCINIPGPGTYRLSGRGSVTGFPPNPTADIAEIQWIYRSEDVTEGGKCVGNKHIQGSGAVSFTSTGSLWETPLAEHVVVVGNEWTTNATVEIRLVASRNFSGDFNILAAFDNVTLLMSGEGIFRNGFE